MRVFMRFPGGRFKALTFSYDDGVEQDIRTIEILNTYGMKGTFNLNTGLFHDPAKPYAPGEIHRNLSYADAVALYKDTPHEVAMHGLTHAFFEQLPRENLLFEVMEDRKNLERAFGKVVRGMAYPWGTLKAETLDVLRGANLAYGRTVASTESFGIPEDFLCWNPTAHQGNPKLDALVDRFLAVTPEELRYSRTPQLFYLWGHTYEFEAWGNWNVIEHFCERLGGREKEIWYATNGEIYEYTRAFRRLEWSLDASLAYNPSALPVWVEAGGEIYCIEPGATKAIPTDVRV